MESSLNNSKEDHNQLENSLSSSEKKKKKPSLSVSTKQMVAHVQTPDQIPIPAVTASSAYSYTSAGTMRKHGHLRSKTTTNNQIYVEENQSIPHSTNNKAQSRKDQDDFSDAKRGIE